MIFFRPFDGLIALLLGFAAVYAFLSFESVTGSRAEIRLDNRKIAVLDLNKPTQEQEITTRIGKITVRYGDGAIRVISSPCPHQICLLQGEIQSTREHIICLPAGMTISILDDDAKNPLDEIDAFSY